MNKLQLFVEKRNKEYAEKFAGMETSSLWYVKVRNFHLTSLTEFAKVLGEWAQNEKRPFVGRQEKIDKGYNVAMSSLQSLIAPLIEKKDE